MPLARRVPKRGFNNIWRQPFATVNVSDLAARFQAGAEVGLPELKGAGLVKGKDRVKILGDGEIGHALVVRANAFSKKAAEKIEAAGGKAEVV